MPKQEIVRKRITPKILIKLYPQPVVDKIIEVANDYGNKGEMGIKSFLPQTVNTNHFWHTREGDRYIALNTEGVEQDVSMISENVVGAKDPSYTLNRKFSIPAGTFMIMITYYKKYIMKVYTCQAAKKLGLVNEELVAKLESDPIKAETMAYAQNLTKDRKAQLPSKSEDVALVLPDAVFHLPQLDSETGEVKQAEVEQLPDNLVNPVVGDVATNPQNYDIQPAKREPKVLQPRKRRTKPLEIMPTTTAPISNLKMRSPDGINLYHGEVVIIGIGDNEGKEVVATMKIGGRKWITLSGGWEYEIPTGNMKEIMGVYHTNFSRIDGNWKGNNKAGNGWKIREDWLKTIIETK